MIPGIFENNQARILLTQSTFGQKNKKGMELRSPPQYLERK
jgi:hypothetical protein